MTQQNLVLSGVISVLVVLTAGIIVANAMGYNFLSNNQNSNNPQQNNSNLGKQNNQSNQNTPNPSNANANNSQVAPTDVNLPSATQQLSQAEQEMLIKMRQEEKLAHDVYVTLGQTFPSIGQILVNIPKSEQKHTDAVKLVLDKYGIADPITDDTVGVFKDESFTKLYQDLVTKGSASETDALKVGATIEDLDISDLNSDLSKTKNVDIVTAFEKLRNGSYNHLRSFVNKIEQLGQSYTPQYITETQYQTIISSQNTSGRGN